jgi:hypothetical protein
MEFEKQMISVFQRKHPFSEKISDKKCNLPAIQTLHAFLLVIENDDPNFEASFLVEDSILSTGSSSKKWRFAKPIKFFHIPTEQVNDLA